MNFKRNSFFILFSILINKFFSYNFLKTVTTAHSFFNCHSPNLPMVVMTVVEKKKAPANFHWVPALCGTNLMMVVVMLCGGTLVGGVRQENIRLSAFEQCGSSAI